MTYLEVFLLAVALSVDAFVVSFSYGLSFNQNRIKNAILLATFTGVFQGIMPCFGYFLTTFVKSGIAPYANPIIFTIFVFLGLKIIKESFDKDKKTPCCIGLTCLLLIGIATSLDAFSAGISLLLCGNLILKPALLITGITFINSLIGFNLGGKLKYLPTQWLEILAGLILISLGIKALFWM